MRLVSKITILTLLLFLIAACGGSGSTASGGDSRNSAPNAVNDTYTLTSSANLDVLSNDTDADNDNLSIVGLTQPQNGSVAIEDNQIRFSIDPSFTGTDSFTYTIQDGNGSSDTATVTLDVQPENVPPIAVNDSLAGLQNSVLLVMPLLNDSDANNDPLILTAVSVPANGSIELLPDNQLRYIPNNGFIGEETVSYTVSDGSLETEGTITLVLTLPDSGENRVPVAVNDQFVVQVNQNVLLDVLANDSDAENDSLVLTDIVGPSSGVATIVNGQVSYVPDRNYLGEDSFIYIVSDGNQQAAAVVTIQIRTEASNNVPSARDDSAFTRPQQTVSISPFGNDTDADGDPLSLVEISQAQNGTYTLDDNGTPDDFSDDLIIYTPDPGFTGTEILVYTLTDGISEDRAAVNINVQDNLLQTRLVRGSIHKGAVSGALIMLYPVDGDGSPMREQVLAAATSERDGLWTVRVPAASEHVIAIAQGGIFIDESDPDQNILEKRDVDLGPGEILESYLFNAQDSIAISAYTSALIRKARYETQGTGTFRAVIMNNLGFATDAFGFNPFSTIPTEPLVPSPNAELASIRYALDLGGFANAMNANAIELNFATPTPELIDVLIDDLADCELDAQFFGQALTVGASDLVAVTAINNEIRRFRNNNIEIYPNTESAIDIAVCKSDGRSADTTPPVLNLLGDNPQTISVGEAYIESGATAQDDVDGDLQNTVAINTDALDVNTPGTYTVIYSVMDLSGNTSTLTRTVIVEDNNPPVITLLGQSNVTVEGGTAYLDQGVIATDDQDGDITAMVLINNPVDVFSPATYTVTYDVSDSSGNAASQVARQVTVVDSVPPVISLLGINPQIVEAGTQYVESGATAQDAVDGDLSNSVINDSSAVNPATPGTYQVIYTVTDSSGNIAQLQRDVIVQDSTLPVISVLGSNPVNVEAGTVYTDAGATATDSVDGDLSASIVTQNPVNTLIPGVYTVTYTVTDSEGNTASVTRSVNVVDTTSPVLSLIGPSPQFIEAGTAYNELGATAVDSLDGDISSSIVIDSTSVNVVLPGSYSVAYDVSDAAGNMAIQLIRIVTVQDTQSPDLTLLGSNPQIIEAGDVYVELGATATDSLDGDISASIVIDTSSVNTAIPGDYLVSYNVSDSSGNTATEQTRTVQVRDTTPPVISLLGSNPLSLLVNEVYSEPGASAFDTLDGDISGNIIVDSSAVDITQPGNYPVTYNVRDAAGNDAPEQIRIVSVVDTVAPVINLVGSNPQLIEIGDVYIEQGATAMDNVDGDISSSLVIDSSSVDTSTLGDYQVTYNVTDSSGQAATEVIRIVSVVDTTPPVITLLGNDPETVEVGSVYTDAGATVSDIGDPAVTVSDDAASAVDASTVGSYTVTYTATDASGNTSTATRTVDVVDTTPPVITLLGNDPETVEVGSVYTDAGATVSDIGDPAVTVSDDAASAVDASTVGSYTVTYTATDASGNTSTATRTVDVVDTTPPVITLLGNDPETVEVGSVYTDAGATVSDIGDPAVTVSDDAASAVDASTVGSYTVTYTATDASGNTSTATRTVDVVDTTPPVITVLGNDPETVEVGSVYTDAGATVSDIGDPAVTVSDDAASAVDASTVGSYTVTYTATDASGNTSTATRTVDVVDTTPPVITVLGNDPETVEVGSVYTDAGATVSDIGDPAVTVSDDAASAVDASTVGSYTVTYTATDASGNTSTATRTVDVVDTTPPVITVLGNDPETVEVGSVYTDAGATVSDIGDPAVTVSDDAASAVDASTVGSYTVTYTATDASGNTSTETRTVDVIPAVTPTIWLNTGPVIFLPVDVPYSDPATAISTTNTPLSPISYAGTAPWTTQDFTPGSADIGGPYIRTYDISEGPIAAPQMTRTIYVVASLAEADSDGDGVSDLVENAVGSSNDSLNNVTYVDQTVSGGDGSSWASALDALPDTYTSGADTANTNYILLASGTSATSGLDLDGSMESCDNLAFVGSLQPSTSPVEAPAQVSLNNRDNPTSVISGSGSQNVAIADCQGLYLANLDIVDGTGHTLNGTGGGMDLSAGAIVSIENLDIKRNTATTGGAGIAVRDLGTTLDIKGARIVNNRVLAGGGSRFGGGVYVEGEAVLSIDESSTYTSNGRLAPTAISANIVEGNANSHGGGIGVSGDANVDIRHAVISGNSAAGDGGAIYIEDSVTAANIKIIDNLILSNGANNGGAIAVSTSALHRINNNTLMYNDADFSASAYSVINSELQFFNNIAKDNENTGGVTEFDFTAPAGLCSNNWSKQGPYSICTDTETSDADFGLSIISAIGYYLRYTVLTRPVIDTGTLAPLPGATSAEKFGQSGVENRTTDSTNNNVADTVLIDMGYHYPLNDQNGNTDNIILLTPQIEANSSTSIRVRPWVGAEPLGPRHSMFYRIDSASPGLIDNSPSDVTLVVNPTFGTYAGLRFGQMTDLGDGTYMLDVITGASGTVFLQLLSNPDSTAPLEFSGTVTVCTTGVDCP